MKRNGYLRHMVLSMGTNVAMLVLRLMRNVLLARILGPSERGVFALLNTLPDLISAFTSGGLNTALGYQAAKQRNMGLLLTQVLVYGCLLATLLTLLCIVLARELGTHLEATEQLGLLVWLLLAAVPLSVLKVALLTLHNASGATGTYNALRLLESLVPLLLFAGLFFMWRDNALDAAVISWLCGLGLFASLGLYWLGRDHHIALRWDRNGQRELLSYSAKSHPDVLFRQAMLRGDYLLISAMLGSAQLGHYAMATAAAELLFIVPEAVTTPLMKRLLQQEKEMSRLTPLALRLTSTIMFLACLSMAVIGEWLIVTLFGAEYQAAYPALLGLLPGLLGMSHVSILRLDLLGKQRPGSVSWIMGIGAVMNLVLSLLLIPHYGILGAAISSSVAYFSVAVMMLTLYCRLSGVSVWSTLVILPSDVRPLLQMLQRGAA
ncbi:oligosaccharide flippase family protein [Pseudomonas sp. RP23018S]|uniref:oligosaccharide flippase family protein n=1 Tax=Pseudomonas sp. RP23018S TaxID=3096037 RepID=UPI002ACAD572|nr:oligosaccharide flippase family protein [Pseudomonas sp. RP23018S]MDZ5602682.1 oligosaccharide flippase family protein [Pseudomonas sp. RP23018S]